MEYEFVTADVYNKPTLVMEFKDKYSILTNIFMEIVLDYDDKKDWLKAINEIMNGTNKKYDFGVQSGFGADVGKEKTIIYCDFTDEEVEISTKQFKELSEIWFDKLKQFHKTEKIN